MDSSELFSIKSGSKKSLRELETDPMSIQGTQILRTLTWIQQFVSSRMLMRLDRKPLVG